MKQLDQTPVRSLSAPKAIGRTKPPRPPIMPTRPPTAPTLLRVIGRDVLVDGGLAEAHEEAEHEGDGDEGDRPDLEVEADRPVDAAHGIVGRRQRQDRVATADTAKVQ